MATRRSLFVAALVGAVVGCAVAAPIAWAVYTSAATASQSISTRNLVAPTSLTATPSGHDVTLAWTAGQNGSGYAVQTANNGTSSNCASATFTSLATTAATSYTDTGRYTPQGTYQCYKATTTYGTWSSQSANPMAAAQLGFVATSVQLTNGGTAGTLDTGDKIIVTYNQPVTTATGPLATDKVCTNSASSGNIIMLGDTLSTCSATATVSIGAISGGSANKQTVFAATYAWSANNTVLTVTIGTRTTGSQNPTITGILTFNPTTTATGMLSATGSFHNCDTNTGGANCLPTITGSF